MTLTKLAKLANVSVSVVSKAFAGKDGVSEEMRNHVFAVAREHGCFQQFYHAPYDKPVIAVIIPEAISEYYVAYIETLKRLMEENGFTMLISIDNFDRQLSEELVNYYTVHSKVDGLLLLSVANRIPASTSTAIVSVTKNYGNGVFLQMGLQSGIRDCLSYLVEQGHTRIGYVGELLTESKRDLLLAELEKKGLFVRSEWVVTSFSRFQKAGYEGMRSILSCAERPTAVIGAYSQITQGILQCLAEADLRVPQDISVVSMNSIPSPVSATLDVSCIQTNAEKVCEEAIRFLRERMRTETPNTPLTVELTETFHRGESVKNLNE